MAVTVGTNSYVSLAEADTFFSTRLNSTAWTSATEAEKTAALVSATSLLDQRSWTGWTVAEEQALAFPRVITYFDPKQGRVVSPLDVPKRVIDAQLELTLHLLENPDCLESTALPDSLAVSKVDIKGIAKTPVIPSRVYDLISPMLTNSGRTVFRAN